MKSVKEILVLDNYIIEESALPIWVIPNGLWPGHVTWVSHFEKESQNN